MDKKISLKYSMFWLFSIATGCMALNQIIRYIPKINLNFELIYKILLIIILAIMTFKLYCKIYLNKINKLFIVLGLCILVSNIYNLISFFDCIISVGWILAFLYGDAIRRENGEISVKTNIVIFLLLIIVSIIAVLLNYLGRIYNRTNIIGVNYTIYFSIPLLVKLQRKEKVLKWECLLFGLLIILSIVSFKRTTLLAVSCCAIGYFYAKYMTKKRLKYKINFIGFIFVGVLLGAAALWYTKGYIIERLFESLETGGNGRLDIWRQTLKNYKNSNFIELLFGHGYNAVNRAIGLSAHNEFIEMLYDYGIIGVGIYMIILVEFVKRAFKLKKNRQNLYPVVVCSIIVLLIISIFSHVQLYTYVGIPLYAYMGYLVSVKNDKMENRLNESVNGFLLARGI